MHKQPISNSDVVKYDNFLGGSQNFVSFNYQKSELLCMILDLSPFWWLKYPESTLTDFIDSIVAFSSIFLTFSNRKELAIIGVVPEKSEYIYTTDMKIDPNFSSSITCSKNRYLQFAEAKIRENICKLLYDSVSFVNCVNLSGGFIKALCYFKRMLKLHNSRNNQSDFSGRFIVIRTGLVDNSASFMSMMNGVFTAQKHSICIDVCLLNPDDVAGNSMPMTTGGPTGSVSVVSGAGQTGGGSVSSSVPMSNSSVGSVSGASGPGSGSNTVSGSSVAMANELAFDKANVLRQSVDLTNGIYLSINKMRDLLQYFITLYLTDVDDRRFLTMISNSCVDIDFRASCFCHGALVSVGYVCSLCLAVFCRYSTMCMCCWTIFRDKKLVDTTTSTKES